MGEFEKKAVSANIIKIEDIKSKLFNINIDSTSMTEDTQDDQEFEELIDTQVPHTANEMTPSKTQT